MQPGTARPGLLVEHHVLDAPAAQVEGGREPCLPAADDECADLLRGAVGHDDGRGPSPAPRVATRSAASFRTRPGSSSTSGPRRTTRSVWASSAWSTGLGCSGPGADTGTDLRGEEAVAQGEGDVDEA